MQRSILLLSIVFIIIIRRSRLCLSTPSAHALSISFGMPTIRVTCRHYMSRRGADRAFLLNSTNGRMTSPSKKNKANLDTLTPGSMLVRAQSSPPYPHVKMFTSASMSGHCSPGTDIGDDDFSPICSLVSRACRPPDCVTPDRLLYQQRHDFQGVLSPSLSSLQDRPQSNSPLLPTQPLKKQHHDHQVDPTGSYRG